MLVNTSTRPVHPLFAPLYWLLDENKKLDEQPTVENFTRCYQEKCNKNQKPGELEKRLFLECLGGLGFLGGAALLFLGYVRKSKLFEILGGALALSGVGSFAAGFVKYFTLGINKIGKINNVEKEKKKIQVEEVKVNKNQPTASSMALVPYSPPESRSSFFQVPLGERIIDPSYVRQIQRILISSISKIHEKLKRNREWLVDPNLEAAMFIFANPAIFVAYRAMKDFYGLGDEQFVFGSKADRKAYEDSSKARAEYYDSRFAVPNPNIEYQKQMDKFNKLLEEYNISYNSSEDRLKEINEHSTNDEVKRVYRKLARKFHPDRNPGDTEAEGKFKAATEAYDFISEYCARKKVI